MKEFKAGKNEAGQRLDKYLKKILPNASMGFIYKMLRKKNIKLNDKKASGTEIVSVDDKIKIFLSDDTFAKFSVNEDRLMKDFKALSALKTDGLGVVYEDDDILAANKPVSLPRSSTAGINPVLINSRKSRNQRRLIFLQTKGLSDT